MDQIWGDIGQWFKHKPPIPCRRVGNGQGRRLNDARSVKQEVEIERSRAPALLPDPPCIRFEGVQLLEQRLGSELSFEGCRRIQKLVSGIIAYGTRLQISADCDDFAAR